MSRDQEILDQMRGIIDPDLGKDIVSLGFIKDLHHDAEGNVAFTVELTTPACPVKDRFKTQCEEAVSRLPWVKSVTVLMSAAPRRGAAPLAARAPGLAKVAAILAVSSCKGGVGKSTVAVNLAYTLAKMGAKVGIFDADVYGPSLPTMVSPEDSTLYAGENEMIQPVAYEGVKLMSFGFVATQPGQNAAIMRGPMVTQVINQLLTSTGWGELDYLVIDFPPGTGDIQLTLLQLVPITAAVIVTTPQQLSFVDVVKGIQMFDKLKVPTIGVVENMSYFECPGCGGKHHVFGEGARRRLVEQFGIRNSFEVPIVPDISKLGDSGTPFVVAQPGSPHSKVYDGIAEAVVREVSKIRFGAEAKPRLSYAPGRGIVVALADGTERTVKPASLRRACRCALCIEEFTGKQILKPEQVGENVYPVNMQPLGNYAVAVTWSDGHSSSVYPYEAILNLAG